MSINVVKHGKKFAVLVDYIQRGIDYSTKELAEHEASKIRAQAVADKIQVVG